MTHLPTPRLVLWEFVEDDWCAFYRLNADSEAKRFMPSEVWTEAESKAGVLWCIEQANEEPRIFYDLAIAIPKTS